MALGLPSDPHFGTGTSTDDHARGVLAALRAPEPISERALP